MIITISGPHGSGKTTVGKIIADKLNYKFFSTGDARGEIALKHNMTMNELNKVGETEAWPHKEVDDYIQELGTKADDIVIDSWLAFHFIPKSFKIFFKINPKTAAERIFKQKQADSSVREDEEKTKDVEDTIRDIKEKTDSWKIGIKKLYDIDPFDEKHYDIVVDTSNLTIEQVVDDLLAKIKDLVNTETI